MEMFCYQCEQTTRGTGCDKLGVCGKNPVTAALQDVLLHVAQGVAMYLWRAREQGAVDREADRQVVDALFTTVTNVEFDPERLAGDVRCLVDVRDGARALYEAACAAKGVRPEKLSGPATFEPAADTAGILGQWASIGIPARRAALGNDAAGLQELLVYGVKGMAAYAHHAATFGREDEQVHAFFEEALDAAASETRLDALLGLALRCGATNLRVMEMLDEAHTSTFGHPEPTKVRTEPRKGKAILVSGHDLDALAALLRQTEGTGIQVYTHGEMLPAHGYPGLKKHAHLAGNYGGAWQDQAREFDAFPGPILMTTNCIQRPRESYKARIFTYGLVGWPGVTHIAGPDFTAVIASALAAPGFDADGPDRTILVGFGRNAVLSVAGAVVDAVKSGAIRHFFLVGGCDGAKPGRDYYTRFAEQVPRDCVILTLACGKFRFHKHDFGDIGGIPRLLDVGQCNDAYSAIRIAVALAEAFGTDVNALPLSLVLSWYEQKAVAILLTLLHLGIRNIRIGPSLPAFLTPAAVGVLVDRFALTPITTPEADLKAILG
jgi:hydroxylamine reductase